jgi:phosphatidylglycerophosphate synthase
MLDKIAVICPNIGIVYSGMGPDFRVLVAKARKSAQAYWKIYGEYPPTKVLTQEIATVMQEATQRGCVPSHRICKRLTALQWCSAFWRVIARSRMGYQSRSNIVPG